MNGFDVRDRPWILARSLEGTTQEYSILEILRRAHLLEAIVGDVPTQTFAITRLLLAVMHASLAHDLADDDTARALWQDLWEAETLPAETIERYLREPNRASRFDLFDEEAPFLQVAGLRTAKDDVAGLERIIADIPNGVPYLTMRRGRGVASISMAEAARWLVHVHAYDTSGIKSGAVGDVRVKGGRGYPLGTGWCGEIGGLLASGQSLKETLLLNFVLIHDDRPVAAGLPVWDRQALGPGVELRPQQPGGGETEPSRPQGLADLYTWPGRRVRLVRSGDAVTGVVLGYGDPLRPQNAHVFEPLSPWRYSEPQSKKLGRSVYMPATHQPDRRLWQGLSSLLPNAQQTTPSAWLVEWIGLLADEGILPDSALFDLRAVGASYGTQSSVIDEIIDDSLGIRALLVSERGAEHALRAVSAVSATEAAVLALARLAGDLEIARGGDSDGARSRSREDAYFALDGPFRSWLADLGSETSTIPLVRWQQTARRVLDEIADSYLSAAGPSAWVGRDRRTTGHASSSEAREWFRRSLRASLPSAYDPPIFLTTEGVSENV
ncbi:MULTISPECIES: type I-E CRISPR-associated protein Cse1/CasA [unclassified Rathayibacter]|uniref:type I-E CRISPR-associated protein Cse1/CasA n=1 Tax=unclassified Rathayibacter TaxID=2609250 RepID=UPI00188CE325|nr:MULTISPECIES: type I-E CRISPR-associated protein Cse1/CasA [unclassified Rathayibacter]MBF4460959.1 type I-E CRISPR-associated protein Cse1/CasA [Rathayibacter sp. VKM Ac-2879]MBF4502370.1 type I-E CRISPR-associated protein Cse1/CasA [Rathayibacter sp. VKM Ac-2878]